MPKQKKTPKRVQLPEPSISSSPIKEKEGYLLYAPRRTRFAKRSLPNGDTSVTDTPINDSEKPNRTINCSGTVVRKKYNTRKSTQLEESKESSLEDYESTLVPSLRDKLSIKDKDKDTTRNIREDSESDKNDNDDNADNEGGDTCHKDTSTLDTGTLSATADKPTDVQETEPENDESKVTTSRLGAYSTSSSYLSTYGSHCVTEDTVETYFRGDKVAAPLMYPNIDPLVLQNVSDIKFGHFQNGFDALNDMYQGLFHYWFCQLVSNFNILLYGVGSKLRLLNNFSKQKLSHSYQMIIYGFFPQQTLKGILQAVINDVLELSDKFQSLYEQCKFICTSLCDRKLTLYLIIHNIDGYPLQDHKLQSTLSLLATCPYVHIIASVDHPHAPLLWDEVTLGRFNWVWHHTPTYEQYTTELSFTNTKTTQISDESSLTSFSRVINSLTSNAKGIFKLLASHQLECVEEDKSYSGITFSLLYQKCREDFLVNSESNLRTHLTEFLDHKLVRNKKGQDGTETLLIPLQSNLLKQFISKQFDL